MLTRRTLVKGGVAALAGVHCARLDLGLSASASYDEVLTALQRTDLEYGGGLSNHAPMVADALVAGGMPERVASWVNRYAMQLEAQPAAAAALDDAAQGEALGHFERRAAWEATFQAELDGATPEVVVKRHFAALSPGLVAAGWHGLLRTAHAVRALQRADSPAARLELARGLAFMAARYQELPGTPGAGVVTGLEVGAALARLTPLPKSKQNTTGLIHERFSVLAGQSAYVGAVESFDVNALPVQITVTELVASAARLFVNDGTQNFLLLHAITGTAALRLVLPWLDVEGQRTVLGHAFAAVAGALVAQGSSDPLADVPLATRTPEVLLEAGLGHDDEHHIKLAEAGVREFQLTGRPEVLRAVESLLFP